MYRALRRAMASSPREAPLIIGQRLGKRRNPKDFLGSAAMGDSPRHLALKNLRVVGQTGIRPDRIKPPPFAAF